MSVTWSGMSGSSSSISIKASPEINWGVSPAYSKHTSERLLIISISLSIFYASLEPSGLTYVSIPQPPPLSLVPPLGCIYIPPVNLLCTDQPRASFQTVGCRWLWWQWVACRGPHGEASEEMEEGLKIETHNRKRHNRTIQLCCFTV